MFSKKHPQEVNTLRHITVRNYIHQEQLRRQYLDAAAIMQRHHVSRATAYRYLTKIGEGEKIVLHCQGGHASTMALISAVDRIHAASLPGNPHITPEHQQKAAAARWAAPPKENP